MTNLLEGGCRSFSHVWSSAACSGLNQLLMEGITRVMMKMFTSTYKDVLVVVLLHSAGAPRHISSLMSLSRLLDLSHTQSQLPCANPKTPAHLLDTEIELMMMPPSIHSRIISMHRPLKCH